MTRSTSKNQGFCGENSVAVATSAADLEKSRPLSLDREVLVPTAAQMDLARKIRRRWGDTLKNNLLVGEYLIELRLSKTAWKKNLLGLPMTYSWARRLIKVAQDDRIHSHISQMPGACGTLHKITMLTNRQFEKAIAEGIINPRCTRQDIVDFQRYERQTRAKAHVNVTFELTGGNGRPENELMAELDGLLYSIKKMVGSEFPDVKMKRQVYVRPLTDAIAKKD